MLKIFWKWKTKKQILLLNYKVFNSLLRNVAIFYLISRISVFERGEVYIRFMIMRIFLILYLRP